MKRKFVNASLTLILVGLMSVVSVALWQGTIPIEWLASFGYKGIFILSLVNGIAPIAGPSQVATFFVASKLDPTIVGLAAGIGGSIGELAGYGFGYFFRASQTDAVERKIQRIANWRVLRLSREHSFVPLLVLASIPNPFFDPISALAGSLRIGFAKYYIPVLLGKTIRHLVIAYAGYYALSGHLTLTLEKALMTGYPHAVLLVALMLLIALFAWGFRSIFEDEPDPLILNFTFFAFAGQGILTLEAWHNGAVLVLLVPAGLLLLAQMYIIRRQVNTTFDRYVKLLRTRSRVKLPPGEIEAWAKILVRITGVDFFPEFYQKYIKFGSPREKRREQAIAVLPRDKFNCFDESGETGNGLATPTVIENEHEQSTEKIAEDEANRGLTANDLVIPGPERQLLWRCYVGICVLSWVCFIICILVAKARQ